MSKLKTLLTSLVDASALSGNALSKKPSTPPLIAQVKDGSTLVALKRFNVNIKS
jgi:hypothetical protein